MIPVSLEPVEWHSWPAERCTFCTNQTRHWYIPKNKPVCLSCAEVFNVERFNKSVINRDEWR